MIVTYCLRRGTNINKKFLLNNNRHSRVLSTSSAYMYNNNNHTRALSTRSDWLLSSIDNKSIDMLCKVWLGNVRDLSVNEILLSLNLFARYNQIGLVEYALNILKNKGEMEAINNKTYTELIRMRAYRNDLFDVNDLLEKSKNIMNGKDIEEIIDLLSRQIVIGPHMIDMCERILEYSVKQNILPSIEKLIEWCEIMPNQCLNIIKAKYIFELSNEQFDIVLCTCFSANCDALLLIDTFKSRCIEHELTSYQAVYEALALIRLGFIEDAQAVLNMNELDSTSEVNDDKLVKYIFNHISHHPNVVKYLDDTIKSSDLAVNKSLKHNIKKCLAKRKTRRKKR